MPEKYLIRTLILPLLTATIIALAAGALVPWQGLLVNLATTFIGILLTVFYVDWVLRQHEDRRWATVSGLVYHRVESVTNGVISTIRSAFGVSADVIDRSALENADRVRMRSEMIRIATHILIPMVDNRVDRMNQKEWKSFVRNLTSMWHAVDRALEMYGTRLEPSTLSLLMDLQDRISGLLAMHSTFFDVYGVPDDQLTPLTTGDSAVPLKEWLTFGAAASVREILISAVSLLTTLPPPSR